MPNLNPTGLRALAGQLAGPTGPALPGQGPSNALLRNRPAVAPSTVGQMVMKAPTFRNEVAFHPTPDGARLAMLDTIRSAERSVSVEMFIWHNDASGNEIADAIIAKVQEAKAAGRPFEARVLIDWTGLRGAGGGTDDLKIVEKLRAGGVQVLEFNPGGIDPSARGQTPITHRKLIIADGARFVTGGRNIGDEYLRPEYTLADRRKEKAWTDLALTITGEEAHRAWQEFNKTWALAGGPAPTITPPVVPSSHGRVRMQSVVTDPHQGLTRIRDAHRELIANAKSDLLLVYPYFSDDEIIQEIIEAKKANPNLRVRVLVPGKGEASYSGKLYGPLNLESARQLMAYGVEVRFSERFMREGVETEAYSHFKAMLVDGQVLSVGSANGDARTMTSNHELNVLIDDPMAVRTFANSVLEADWARGRAPTPEELKGTWWSRLVARVFEAIDFML